MAQENGDFAEAFWLCSQCSASMESLRQLRVSSQLTQTIQDLHDETTLRLHNALQVSCADFRPEPYSKVSKHCLPCHVAVVLCPATPLLEDKEMEDLQASASQQDLSLVPVMAIVLHVHDI